MNGLAEVLGQGLLRPVVLHAAFILESQIIPCPALSLSRCLTFLRDVEPGPCVLQAGIFIFAPSMLNT